MMTVAKEDSWRLPVKSWCAELEDTARRQAANLSDAALDWEGLADARRKQDQ